MYSVTLTLHSFLRWLVLLAGVAAAGRAIIGWLKSAKWTNLDMRLGLLFMIGVDVQFLLGIILYLFLSPITNLAFSDFAAAMADSDVRFFTVEHILLMIFALVLVHVGRALTRRATEDAQRHKRAAILFGIALLAVLVAIPWNRPLLRLG